MKMLGHDFVIETDLQRIDEAEMITDDMTHFPEESYIRDCGEYVIINF